MTIQPSSDENEVMTLTEVADYLQLAERTVLRMAQRGEIPAAKIASQWRFMRSLVRDWLAGRMLTVPPSELKGMAGRETVTLPLGEVVRPELMNMELTPGPKDSILKQLVGPLRESGFARDPDRLLVSLVNRERMMSTAVGHGVALPHPRKPIPGMFAEPAVALGVCREGTDFNALDDRLVHLFFLICATRDEIHLQLMAEVSWLARQDVLSRLVRASSPEEAGAIVGKAVAGFQRRPSD